MRWINCDLEPVFRDPGIARYGKVYLCRCAPGRNASIFHTTFSGVSCSSEIGWTSLSPVSAGRETMPATVVPPVRSGLAGRRWRGGGLAVLVAGGDGFEIARWELLLRCGGGLGVSGSACNQRDGADSQRLPQSDEQVGFGMHQQLLLHYVLRRPAAAIAAAMLGWDGAFHGYRPARRGRDCCFD